MKNIDTDKIHNIRSAGLIMAFDCNNRETRDKLLNVMKDKYYMLGLASGNRSIRFRPNLAVESEDINKCVDIINESIRDI